MTIKIIKTNDPNFKATFKKYCLPDHLHDKQLSNEVEKIIAKVISKDKTFLQNINFKFDKFPKNQDYRIPTQLMSKAWKKLDTKTKSAIKFATKRITEYHKLQKFRNINYHDKKTKLKLSLRYNPIEAVGLYVPGGMAAYPSSLWMSAIPAKIAKVPRIVVVSPANNGIVNPALLASMHYLKINEAYSIGGAQAVACLAYGFEDISPVAKIVGPGNKYVSEAKRQVFGQVGIDCLAGPSEILVITDENTNPEFAALDVLAQAEHDPDARTFIITSSLENALNIKKIISKHLNSAKRAEIIKNALKNNSLIIISNSLDQTVKYANLIAPEHLAILTQKPNLIANRILNAGAIFCGEYSAPAFGDYTFGTNHILPTKRAARYSSPLSVQDFLKKTSVIKASQNTFKLLNSKTQLLANLEGLDAHADSIKVRQQNNFLQKK